MAIMEGLCFYDLSGVFDEWINVNDRVLLFICRCLYWIWITNIGKSPLFNFGDTIMSLNLLVFEHYYQ